VVSANAVKAHHQQRTPTVNPQKNAKYTARGGAVELVELEAVENGDGDTSQRGGGGDGSDALPRGWTKLLVEASQ